MTLPFGAGPGTRFPTAIVSEEIKHASKLPLAVSLTALLIGSALVPMAFWLETRWLFVIGYLLTPITQLICLAWDSLGQRAGSKDPWFAVNPGSSRFVKVLAWISFLPGIAHIWFISDWLGEVAVQNGWF